MAMMLEICKAAMLGLIRTASIAAIAIIMLTLLFGQTTLGVVLLGAVCVYVVTSRMISAIEAEEDAPGEGGADE